MLKDLKNYKTLILEVDTDGEEYHLAFKDGSKWFVNPSDLPTIATWLPSTEVYFSNNNSSVFNFNITNTKDDITIRAMLVI